MLLDMGFTPRETQRSGNSLLYFKQADAIADFFTTIGAPSTAMQIMTAKVEKEMRNTVTRQINCDSANADKTVLAAEAQLRAIKYIAREYGLDALPDQLKDAALLRITIHEGRNRQIRRLCERANVTVTRLRRIAEGPLTLGELKPGQWRRLTPEELRKL